MTGGEIAGLIAAVAFVLLVGVLAIPLVKLGKVLDEAGRLIEGVSTQTVPLLQEVTVSVTQVNAELTRVDTITSHVQEVSGNVAAITSLFSATFGGPLVKAAAFSYGVRRVLRDRDRADVEKRVKREMRTERAAARQAKRAARQAAGD